MTITHIPGRQHVAAYALSCVTGLVSAVIGMGDHALVCQGVIETWSASTNNCFASMKTKAAAGTDAFSMRNNMVVHLMGNTFVPVIPNDATDLI